jgi:hypothetical protein
MAGFEYDSRFIARSNSRRCAESNSNTYGLLAENHSRRIIPNFESA